MPSEYRTSTGTTIGQNAWKSNAGSPADEGPAFEDMASVDTPTCGAIDSFRNVRNPRKETFFSLPGAGTSPDPQSKRHAMNLGRYLLLTVLIVFPAVLSGCQSTYYTVWETLGKEKRHLLRDNIEKAQAEQEEAQEGFKDVLTRMKELYGFEGGDLEAFYTRLRDDYEACEGPRERR